MKPILFNTEMVRAILEDRKTVTRRVVKPQPCDGHGSVKFKQWFHRDWYTTLARFEDDVSAALCDRKPPCHPGDILWVRETFFKEECTPDCAGQSDPNECPFNRVGDSCYGYKTQYIDSTGEIKWRPSIHMPKEAARLFLRVTGVRVERLQDSFFAQGDTIAALYDEGIDIGDYCRQCIESYGNPCCNDLDPELEPNENGEDENGGSECGMLDEVRSDFARLWDSTIKPADRPRYGWDANPWVWVVEFERISKEAALGGGGDG